MSLTTLTIDSVKSGVLLHTLTFKTVGEGNKTTSRNSYGVILAKIVSILRTLGWIVTFGTCFNEKLIRIPFGKQNHYLYPSTLTEITGRYDISQDTIREIIVNMPLTAGWSSPFTFELNQSNVRSFEGRGVYMLLRHESDVHLISSQIIDKLPPGAYYIYHNSTPRIDEGGIGDEAHAERFKKFIAQHSDKQVVILFTVLGCTHPAEVNKVTLFGQQYPVWRILNYPREPMSRRARNVILKFNLQEVADGIRRNGEGLSRKPIRMREPENPSFEILQIPSVLYTKVKQRAEQAGKDVGSYVLERLEVE